MQKEIAGLKKILGRVCFPDLLVAACTFGASLRAPPPPPPNFNDLPAVLLQMIVIIPNNVHKLR